MSSSLLRVQIVVDALDKAPRSVQETILCPALKQLRSRAGSRIFLFVTSRTEIVIQEAFKAMSNINLEAGLVSQDVARYVEAEIERRPSFLEISSELREQVQE